MDNLNDGVRYFQERVFPSKRALFRRLADGQSPSTLWVTCSDSRIVPNLVTQAEPGELFILRNAGNIVPPYTGAPTGEAAAIEYAVTVLRVRQIVVCGHSQCGAMSGLLQPQQVESLPAVRGWIAHAEPARAAACAKAPGASDAELLPRVIEENVLLQMSHLTTYPFVESAMAKGASGIFGCVYVFERGELLSFDEGTRKFKPLSALASGDAPPNLQA